MAESRAQRRPLWLITNHENGRMGVFTLDPDSNRETLPVFSFEEEAETFLRLGAPGTQWRARKTTGGELISILYGPCAGVKKVTLDPLPGVDGGMFSDLVSLGRDKFLRTFAGGSAVLRERPLVETTASPEPSRNGSEGRTENETDWYEPVSVRAGVQNKEHEPVPASSTRDSASPEDSQHSPNGHHRPSGVPDEAEKELRSEPRIAGV